MRGRAIVVAGVLLARSALADGASPCVAIDGGALDARTRAKVTAQLSAALARHAIATCGPTDEPIARVAYEASGGGEVAIRIHVEDAVTRKELGRMVRVANVPADGRPLALAVAADELLRASWAEIALARAPDPPPAAPPAVQALVRASLPPADARAQPASAPASEAPRETVEPSSEDRDAPPRPRDARPVHLGAALAGEHAFGGLTQGGFDVRAGAWVVPRFAIALRLGARSSMSADAPDGSADATGILAGGGATIALVPRGGGVTLDVPLRVDVEHLQITGHAAPGARAASGSAVGAFASLGLDLGLRVSPALAIDVEATLGAPLRAVEATDASLAFASLSSAIVGLAVGARVAP